MALSTSLRLLVVLSLAGAACHRGYDDYKYEYKNKQGATVSCEPRNNFLQKIVRNSSVDFIELSETGGYFTQVSGILQAGEPCKTATKHRRCLRLVARERTTNKEEGKQRLLITIGDKVWSIDGSQVSSLFGPIDSVEEAALVGYLYGANVCYAKIDRVQEGFLIDVPLILKDPAGACQMFPVTHMVSFEGSFTPGDGLGRCR